MNENSIRELIVKSAQNCLGIHKHSCNTAVTVETFNKFTNTNKNSPWSLSFVLYCINSGLVEAGKQFSDSGLLITSSISKLVNHAQETDRFIGYQQASLQNSIVRSGDIVVNWSYTKQCWNNAGIIESNKISPNSTYFSSIDGETTPTGISFLSSDGYIVARHYKSTEDLTSDLHSCYGFIGIL